METTPVVMTQRQLLWLVLSAIALGLGIGLRSQAFARLVGAMGERTYS